MVEIRVEGLVKIYTAPGYRVQALKGVSFRVDGGEIVSIMGPSGSGKTTLLNIIGGIDRPTAGKVVVDSTDISYLSEKQLREYRLHRVGYIFQFFNLIPTLTALENVMVPMITAGRKRGEAAERARRLLEMVGLADKAGRLPEHLSGGERQRLAIAIALANNPDIVLADEPTGELDLANAEKIMKILVDLAHNEGKAVIVSTHDPRVARMTDRIIMLQDGTITGIYEPESLTGTTALDEVSTERTLVEYIRSRLEKTRKEMELLAKMFREGRISSEEFVRRYLVLKYTIAAWKAELSRLGAGVEALE